MSETQTAVATVARPLRSVAQIGQTAVLPRRPGAAPVPAFRPEPGEDEPADGPSAAGAQPLRERVAHCRIAMQYLD
ncbi:hypothetical protein OG535_37305 [Kitasatospora sp. NBC_00085]|uniref:hypothetical protein n=1 Tax=unclassified Kitasatospora TaxID=2633591 RepID=UPI00325106CE